MTAVVFALLAAVCAALSSLCFRKNVDRTVGDSTYSYLLYFYGIGFVSSLLWNFSIWSSPISWFFTIIGACTGILTTLMMIFTSKALHCGPAGLTYAFQNASAVFPAFILTMVFGKNFGFSVTLLQSLGIISVLLGLYVGARNKKNTGSASISLSWLKYALCCFMAQILSLTFVQARCVIFSPYLSSLLPSDAPTVADDLWFMPGQFGASSVFMVIEYFSRRETIQKASIWFGSVGGVCNFASTCFLMLATFYAQSVEQSFIFPCFAITTLFLCNMWAKAIYNETFNVTSNMLCLTGIFIASP